MVATSFTYMYTVQGLGDSSDSAIIVVIRVTIMIAIAKNTVALKVAIVPMFYVTIPTFYATIRTFYVTIRTFYTKVSNVLCDNVLTRPALIRATPQKLILTIKFTWHQLSLPVGALCLWLCRTIPR